MRHKLLELCLQFVNLDLTRDRGRLAPTVNRHQSAADNGDGREGGKRLQFADIDKLPLDWHHRSREVTAIIGNNQRR